MKELTLDDIVRLYGEFHSTEEAYKAKFDESFGTYEWGFRGGLLPKAIELMRRAMERGSPATEEEYYMELVGLSREEYEKFLRGGIIF
jgi:hypothetical protein